MKRTMKKLLPLCLILTVLLAAAGCSAGASLPILSNGAKTASVESKSGGVSFYASDAMAYDDGEAAYAEPAYEMPAAAPGSSAFFQGSDAPARADTYDKIIYSGSASVETIRFEETVDQVYSLIEQYSAFLESSYVTGKDYSTTYYNRPGYRSASFTVRVPRENFQSFTGALESLGNVTSSSVSAQNITSSYFDTQSRLNTYRTEEERLLDMLSKADTVEDMLNIEDRLADVRYNIESLTTTLNNWDSKVNYSTLDLYISEVKELTPETPVTRTFGEELSQGFRNTCQWLGRAAKDAVIYLVSILPVLVILAVIVLVVVLIIRAKRHKKSKEKDVDSAR